MKKTKKNLKGDTLKYFYKLTDKNLLKKLALYDVLSVKHLTLQGKIYNLKRNNKNFSFDKDISYLLMKSETISNLLEKELKNLILIYNQTGYRNLINNIGLFDNLLKNWSKTLKILKVLLYQIEKNNITKQQKQR